MPLFRYKALAETGRTISGVIDADSQTVAKERLRKQKVMVTSIGLLKDNKKEIGLDRTLLLSFTKELGQLLRAGLPVYESLLTLEEKYRRHKSHSLFLDLCDRLKSGSSLSASLRQYPKTFDEIYLSMVTSAEQSGSLAQIFDQLSTLINKQQKLRKQLFSALIYPAFLGSFCCIVIFSLLLFVVPSMRDLFEGRPLHPITHIVLALSTFVNQAWPFLLFGVLLAGVSAVTFFRNPQGRLLIERGLLKLPLIKTLIIQAALIRFCRSLAVLLQGGVPLITSLSLSRKVMKQALLEAVIEKAEKRIGEGKKLSDELKSSPLIPSLVTRMLSLAEETGKTVPMLQNIADIYDEEMETHLSQMTALLQPMILLILGGVVGLILLAVLLPLTDVSSFLST